MNLAPLTGLLTMDSRTCLETQVASPKSVPSNSLGPAGQIHLREKSEDYERNRQETTGRVGTASSEF